MNQPTPTAAAPSGQVEIAITRIYVKDFSYESPKAPQVFQQQHQWPLPQQAEQHQPVTQQQKKTSSQSS